MTSPPLYRRREERSPTSDIGPTGNHPIDDDLDAMINTESGPGAVGVATVLAINESAELYASLCRRIQGTAVGWSPTALARLRDGLATRFGPLIDANPDRALDHLIEVATRSSEKAA